MNNKAKIIRALICAAVIAALIPGCGSKDKDSIVTSGNVTAVTTADSASPTDGTSNDTPGTATVGGADAPGTVNPPASDAPSSDAPAPDTPASDAPSTDGHVHGSDCDHSTDAPAANTGTSDSGTATNDEHAEIKKIYTATPEQIEHLKEEATAVPITYTGFTGQFASTPAKSEDVHIAEITPIYSHSGIQKYISDYSEKFELDAFASAAEKYDDAYFTDKGILIISFLDSDGGKDYVLTGAYDDHVSIEEYEMDRLVLAVKKSTGDITASHLIVELDVDYLSIWDTFGIEIYE